MSKEKPVAKNRQEEFDELLKKAMENPGVATLIELMESLRGDLERLEEFSRVTQPIIVTTTSAGTE